MEENLPKASTHKNTIAEIAAQAGVSIPTVSRVLNGRPDVAPATRAHIEQIIKESGYVRRCRSPWRTRSRLPVSRSNELGRWTHGCGVFTFAWTPTHCHYCRSTSTTV